MVRSEASFEDHAQAAHWFDSADTAAIERRNIGRDDAMALFGLR